VAKPSDKIPKADQAILDELHRRFTYGTDEWRDTREEGQKDMRCVAGDPWDDDDRKQREDANRPVLSLDELGQYVNQLINEIRQNKRAVKVTPIGAGANDKRAELRANLFRQIEYRSNAQQAYTTMFENAVQRSYGYLRIKPKYVSERSFDQELIIEPLVNPDMVTIDPDFIQPDASDIKWAVIRESWSHDDFKRAWPKAQFTSFTAEMIASVPDWLDEHRVYVGEYWTTETTEDQLLLVQPNAPKQRLMPGQPPPPPPQPVKVLQSEYDDGKVKGKILQARDVEVPRITQYFTNGVEILKTTAWPGRFIPLIACFGKVLYVDEGSGSKRKLLSLVRLARDPYMLYCYYRTTEAEIVGMTPKTPFIGYKGQFRGMELEWQKINHEPAPYLEAEPYTERTGGQLLPLPERQPYDPPIQALEIGAESARRAIQSAMGSMPLPSQAQRSNEKSGVALRHISDVSQRGNYHFVDHYEMAITRLATVANDLIPHYYDTQRDVTVRTDTDQTQVVKVNDPQNPDSQLDPTEDHDVTLSTGPSYDSEREAASDFADQLVQNPQVFPLIASDVVRLKNLGPIGDTIAKKLEILQPPALREQESGKAPDPKKLQQQLADMQHQMQQAQQTLQQQHQVIQTDQVKADNQFKIEQMKMQGQSQLAIMLKQMDNAAKIEAARISAAKEASNAQAELIEERIALHADHAHDVGMAGLEHQHALEQAQQGAQIQSQQSVQQAALQPPPQQGPPQ